VVANASELHQIVVNLGRNACQATRAAGGGVVEVALGPLDVAGGDGTAHPDLQEGRYVCFTVRDRGCGMDGDTMGRIFDPFFTTKDVGEGVGLGLAIVHAIVDGLDGVLRVGSTPGHGSTFQVFIPRHDRGSVTKRTGAAGGG
jgi:signal transduction histidine kinase